MEELSPAKNMERKKSCTFHPQEPRGRRPSKIISPRLSQAQLTCMRVTWEDPTQTHGPWKQLVLKSSRY
ncbi:hypothetical protein CapIbe_005429 [Capra ibex]